MTPSSQAVGEGGRHPNDTWGGPDTLGGDTFEAAERLPIRRTVVFGGGERGRGLARRLASRGPVRFVDRDRRVVERAARDGDAVLVDGFGDAAAIAAAAVTPEDRVVVATGQDSTNLLLVQVLRSAYGVRRLVVLVEDPTKRPAFDALGVRLVSVTDVLGAVLVDRLDDPDLAPAVETDTSREVV